jgi:hypothetical protein
MRAHVKYLRMAKEAKSPGAALAAQRWEKTSEAERSEVAREISNSRWANATPEQREAQGKMLAEARAAARAKRASTKKKAKKGSKSKS